MGRHSKSDPNDETTTFPAIPPVPPATQDQTTVLPQLRDATTVLPTIKPSPRRSPRPGPDKAAGRAVASDETTILGRILPPPSPLTELPPEPPRDKWSGDPVPPPIKAL